jgi:hypothetical protein
MLPSRSSPIFLLVLSLGLAAQIWAASQDGLPQLLGALDHAGLVQDTNRVKALIAEWKKLEPKAAAPWLKELALRQMSGPVDREAELEVLRRAVQQSLSNRDLHARLAGGCAISARPQEALRHYRWLFEHGADELEKLSWAMQMGTNQVQATARPWFAWQCLQHPQEALWPVCAAEMFFEGGNWAGDPAR